MAWRLSESNKNVSYKNISKQKENNAGEKKAMKAHSVQIFCVSMCDNRCTNQFV